MNLLSVKNILGILWSGLLLSSCTFEEKRDSNPYESALVSVDSLNANWNKGWNENDPNAIAAMFTEKSLVMEGDWIVVGRESIMEEWVIGQMPRMDNFKTEKIYAGVTADMAFYCGTYTLDILRNDSIVGTSDGNYTAIWKKQLDNSWKVETLHMGNISE